MKYSDYIVTIDENGQPYIEHVSWGGVKSSVKGAANRAHKYLLKVGEGAKAQYAYTKEEVDRLMGRGRQKVKNVTGATAKENRDKAYADMVSASRDAGRAQTRAASSALIASRANKDSYDAARRQDVARYNAQLATENVTNAKASDSNSKSALREASKNYEEAKDNATRWITTRKDYEALDSAKEQYDRALDDRRRATSERKIAEKEEKEAISKYDHATHELKAKNNAKNKADRSAKEAAEEANYYENRWAPLFKHRYDRASEDYSKTPLAKVKEAASNAKDKASDAIDKAKVVASSAKDKASDTIDKAKVVASNAREKASEAADKVKGVASTAKDKVSNVIGDVKEKAKDIAGYDERERLRVAEKRHAQDREISNDAVERLGDSIGRGEMNDGNPNGKNFDNALKRRNEALDNEDRSGDGVRQAREDYAKTPLGMLEKAKSTVENIPFEVEWAVSSAANKVKVKAAERKVDSVEKLMDKYKRPSMNIYTYDRQTGKTIRAQEQYDTYMGKANDLLNTMKANAAKGKAPSQDQIAEVKRLYERAIGH